MNLFQEFSQSELLITDVKFLGLKQMAWEFTRGMRLRREYLYEDDTIAVRDSYEYTMSEDQRSIVDLCRKIAWFDDQGVQQLEKDVTPQLNIKNLKSLNREIRQGRLDYMIGAAEQLAILAPSMPEPYATDFVKASHSIGVIMSVYRDQISDYIENGTIGFEAVILNESNPIMLEIFDLAVRPPDEQFPTGLTIKETILHQLTGSY